MAGAWAAQLVSAQEHEKPRVPRRGAYIAISVDAQNPSFPDLANAVGVRHSMFMAFFRFPELLTDEQENAKAKNFLATCRRVGAVAVLTVETFGGLESYTRSDLRALAKLLNKFRGPVIVRWNHEMNGSWYIWGQQPTLYIKKFRELHGVLKRGAPRVALAWTPNQGWGFPWAGNEYSVAPSSPDYAVLDTSKDGVLSSDDNPYTPFFPGRKFVDWVGVSFYHWGNQLTEGFNEVPPDTKWGESLGTTRSVINFHDEIAKKFRKPMLVAETAAFFDPSDCRGGGATELAIKSSWIRQLYNVGDDSLPSLSKNFPLIKAITWFNELKIEADLDQVVDWRIDGDPEVAAVYRDAVSHPYFVQGRK
jgi:hypothetical protein